MRRVSGLAVCGLLGVGLVACGASQTPAKQPAGPERGESNTLAPSPPPPSAPRPASTTEQPAQGDDEDADMAAYQVAMDKWMVEHRARAASPEVDRAPESPPPPLPRSLNVPPQALDAMRIAGVKNIVPDDATKMAISEAGKDKLIGSFLLCIRRSGGVALARQLKTTGFPSYDQKIINTMRTQWRYRPFLVDNKPTRVCTNVTFIYSQYAARPTPKAPQPPPRARSPDPTP